MGLALSNELAESSQFDVVGPAIGPININNYDVLEQSIQDLNAQIESTEITEDGLKEAKSKRAQIKKLKTALNKRRIDISRQYKEPLEQFKESVDHLMKELDGSFSHLDTNIKAFEFRQKSERTEMVRGFIQEIADGRDMKPADIQLLDSWTIASISKVQIKREIGAAFDEVERQRKQKLAAINQVKTVAEIMHMDPAGWLSNLENGAPVDQVIESMKLAHDRATVDKQTVTTERTVDLDTGEIHEESVKPYTFTVQITEPQRAELHKYLNAHSIDFWEVN